MPPAAPFLPTAEEMGERTPPKTNGFWISFRPNVTTVQKGPQRIASASTLAAAGVVGREHLRFYRFEQLSNHALAAVRVREVKITGSVKRFRCTERVEKFPLWNAGAAAGMGGRRFRVLPPAVLFPSSSGRGCSVSSGTGHFWPQRPANFSLLCLRRPRFFQQRKKWGKERRQKPMVFGFPLGRM